MLLSAEEIYCFLLDKCTSREFNCMVIFVNQIIIFETREKAVAQRVFLNVRF